MMIEIANALGAFYDPYCGTSGMFVQSIKFIEAYHGNNKEDSYY